MKKERFAEAVIIATPDQVHVGPAVNFADQGFHILLEKPMATTIEDCWSIYKAVKRNNIILAVCHVLR
jgi:predicted dehydrogenase